MISFWMASTSGKPASGAQQRNYKLLQPVSVAQHNACKRMLVVNTTIRFKRVSGLSARRGKGCGVTYEPGES